MPMFQGVSEYLPVGIDFDGNARRAVDKDRAGDSASTTFAAYGGAGHSFLTVPTGKVARLLSVMINNKEVTDIGLTLKDAATQKVANIAVSKASSSVGHTVVLDESDLRGYKFATSIIGIVNGVHGNDTEVSITYWIDPQLVE